MRYYRTWEMYWSEILGRSCPHGPVLEVNLKRFYVVTELFGFKGCEPRRRTGRIIPGSCIYFAHHGTAAACAHRATQSASKNSTTF